MNIIKMNKKNKPSMFSSAFYNNPDNRAIIYQIIALISIFIFTYFVLNNMFINIDWQHVPHYLHLTAWKAAAYYCIYDSCANKYDHIAKTCLAVDNWRIWDTK